MIKIEHNVETGEIVEIPFSAAEVKAFNDEAKIENDRIAALISERETKIEETIAPKLAALMELGLTEEKARLILQ
jgi:hypothetical protein